MNYTIIQKYLQSSIVLLPLPFIIWLLRLQHKKIRKSLYILYYCIFIVFYMLEQSLQKTLSLAWAKNPHNYIKTHVIEWDKRWLCNGP